MYCDNIYNSDLTGVEVDSYIEANGIVNYQLDYSCYKISYNELYNQ